MDGSGWEGVYKILRKDGYNVSIVQNPTISLADDVAVTKRVIATQNGPVILVGHSYGGAVITEAGNDPKVAGLVYIAAFAPDKGESVSTLIKDPPPGAPVPPILPPQDGFLFLDKAKFPASFAATWTRRRPRSWPTPRSLGRRSTQRHDQRAGLEDQAELVSGRHRRQDDSTAGPAFHVQARGFDGRRGRGQSDGPAVQIRPRTRDASVPGFISGARLHVRLAPQPGWRLAALRQCIPEAGVHAILRRDRDGLHRTDIRLTWTAPFRLHVTMPAVPSMGS